MSTTTLYKIYQWVERFGPARSEARFRMKLLMFSVREHISFDDLTVSTTVSEEFIAAAKTSASAIVGKPFDSSKAAA